MVNIAFKRRLTNAIIVMVGWLAILPIGGWANDFTFFTYHDKPPYFENRSIGQSNSPSLYEAFVDYLNNKQSDINVTLVFQPRKRLEESLRKNRLGGGVLGVNPLWFDDREKMKYLWSDAFMLDQDIVVTKLGNEFTYQHPKDLIGKRLALPRGLYFWGVSELIDDKKVEVYETSSDLQDLEMVLLNRADATITSQLTFNYFSNTRYSAEQFSILATPHDQFERHVLFPKRYQNIYQSLAPVIANAINDPEWLSVLQQYQNEQQKVDRD